MPAALVRADEGPGSFVMNLLVYPECAAPQPGASTARVLAYKGHVAAMAAQVQSQGRRPEEGLSTGLVRTDVRLLSCMGPCVYCQIAVSGKGASTADLLAGKGFFSGMSPVVPFQVGGQGKGSATVRVLAGIRLFSCMDTAVYPQGCRLRTDRAAAFIRTDPGFFAGVDMQASCLACLAAQGLSRGAWADARHGQDNVRDRGAVHGGRRCG